MPHFPVYILYLDRARLFGQNSCLLCLHIPRPGLVVYPNYPPENTSGVGETSFCTGTALRFFQARIRYTGDLAL